MQRKIVAVLVLILFIFNVNAQQPQDKNALQQQRENLRKEIAETEKALEEVRKTATGKVGIDIS